MSSRIGARRFIHAFVLALVVPFVFVQCTVCQVNAKELLECGRVSTGYTLSPNP